MSDYSILNVTSLTAAVIILTLMLIFVLLWGIRNYKKRRQAEDYHNEYRTAVRKELEGLKDHLENLNK
jgi:predicted membrane protein